jgi:hypothetical protein
MEHLKLFMLLLGCRPPGRNTEQHDVFFGIGLTVKSLVPYINKFWPEAKGRLHVDAWREVNYVDGYSIQVERKDAGTKSEKHLFFINLGGYQRGVFDEPHYKLLTVQPNMASAVKHAKQTMFYKQVQFGSAVSHVDDKFGIDVDDVYPVKDILPAYQRQEFQIKVTRQLTGTEDELHLGYFKLNTLP